MTVAQPPLRVAVAIPTKGRPAVVGEAVAALARQERRPDEIWLAVPSREDLPADIDDVPGVRVLVTELGSSIQRNAIIDAVDPGTDLLVFLDDDTELHAGFLRAAADFAAARPDVAVFMGRVVADGAASEEISRPEARELLAGRLPDDSVTPDARGYSCNMVVRTVVAKAVRFDEGLPLYAWLEDRDFAVRARAHGAVVGYAGCEAVHLGVGGGRQPGVRLGFQQVVHPVYLARKGTVPVLEALLMVVRAFVANVMPSLDGRVDRPGRLRGNLAGLWTVLAHRADPARVHALSA